jgi:hypothetical protein
MFDVINHLESENNIKPKRTYTRRASVTAEGEVKPKVVNKSKRKGNSFENKIAKVLGKWIFNNENMLARSMTSGAIKTVYVGDIVPQKQLGWKGFPFYFEAKNGYKHNISNFNNTTLIDDWLLKALKDRTQEQPIIVLLVAFHSYTPLFITDVELSLPAKIVLKETYNNYVFPFYVYRLKDLMNYNFYDLYRHIPALMEILCES